MNDTKEEISKAKYYALKKYKHIGKLENYCKALKGQVRLSEYGWQHLIKTSRNPSDVLYRLTLLEYIPLVIEQGELKETRKVKNKTTGRSYIQHAVETIVSERIIRAVVEEDEKGGLMFLSIMDKT